MPRRDRFCRCAGLITLLTAWCLLAACRDVDPESGSPVLLETYLRFIEEDPPPSSARGRLFASSSLFDWRPASPPGCLQIWPKRPGEETFRLDHRIARLSWESDRVLISVPGPVEAETVDRIDLEVKSLAGRPDRVGAAALLWKSRRQKFAARRMLDDPAARPAGDDAWLYRFPLGSHPAWRGQVAELRLVLSPSVGSPLALCSLQGVAEELRPEKLPELLRDGLKVDFAGQTRTALPGLPGVAVEGPLRLPRGAELRFAFALPPTVRRPVTFSAALEREDASGLELFQATLSPEPHAAWHHAAVDLSAFAGLQVRLRLETAAEGQIEPERGFPLWGNPEVLAARLDPSR